MYRRISRYSYHIMCKKLIFILFKLFTPRKLTCLELALTSRRYSPITKQGVHAKDHGNTLHLVTLFTSRHHNLNLDCDIRSEGTQYVGSFSTDVSLNLDHDLLDYDLFA